MNTQSTARSLNDAIENYAGGQPVRKVESHDLASLSERILAPRDVVEKLLGAGVLRSDGGPIYANDETGMHGFYSDHLNEVRTAVLGAIVERVVEHSDGDAQQIKLAADMALREHVSGFTRKPGVRRELCRFSPGLVQLARYGGEEPGFAGRVARTVGKSAAVAGLGGLAYGGASWLRGRKPGLNPLAALRAGYRANSDDLKQVSKRTGRVLTSGAADVAALLRRRA